MTVATDGSAEALLRSSQTIVSDEKDWDDTLWAWLQGFGILGKVAFFASQVKRTGSYLLDLASGETEPEGPAHVASGLIYGEREGQPLNPLTAAGE